MRFDKRKLESAARSLGKTQEQMIKDFERILDGQKVCDHLKENSYTR